MGIVDSWTEEPLYTVTRKRFTVIRDAYVCELKIKRRLRDYRSPSATFLKLYQLLANSNGKINE